MHGIVRRRAGARNLRLTIEIVITLATVVGVLALLTTTRFDTDVVLVAAMIALTLAGVIRPEEALSGFASSGGDVGAPSWSYRRLAGDALRTHGQVFPESVSRCNLPEGPTFR